ncbi:putative phospholipase D family [Plasmopara halstedii]
MRLVIVVLLLICGQTPAVAIDFTTIFGDGFDPIAKANNKAATDHSDGSNIAPRQPLLDAEEWFLTEDEITDSRGGVPRKDLSVYTTGNKVTPFTASREFYDAVYDDLSRTKKGDRVMMTSWLTTLVPLKPESDPSGATTGVKEVIAGVVKRGGNVNILNWANIVAGYSSSNVKARDAINKIPPSPINGAKAVLIFDDRLPSLLSSHHQKTIVIAANRSTKTLDQPIAYIGGLDLAFDRWDTMHHNQTSIRKNAKISHDQKGWIDGHVRIHGPAAKDVANNFVARWNIDHIPCTKLDDDLYNFENPAYDKVPPLDYVSSNKTGLFGSHSIQITRTFSCKGGYYKSFAPLGEVSLLRARLKAIKKAKNFIYIEDQYFLFVPELLDALMEVLPKIQRVVVVANRQTNPFKNAGYIKYFYENVKPIRTKYPNKFKIYATKSERDLVINTKVVIIDDVYLSVGSANWNRRSMTSDSELGAEIVDTETVKSPEGFIVGKLPRDFRIRKFQELTGLSYEALDAMTFVEAADRFPHAVADPSSILDYNKLYHHMYMYLFSATDLMRNVADPYDTCT